MDGHDPEAIEEAVAAGEQQTSAPRVLVLRTIFGRGVSFMEGQLRWHYLPMTDAQFRAAMVEVDGTR